MQKRDLRKMLVLNIATLGLYSLYWFYKTKDHLDKNGAGLPSIFCYFVILPLLHILLLSIFIYAALLGFIYFAAPTAYPTDAKLLEAVIKILPGFYFAIISPIIYFAHKFSAAFEKYITKDNNQIGYFIIASAMVTPLAPLVPIVLQNKINEILDKPKN